VKKNQLNRLKFKKNQPVRFRFYKPKTEKTKPNPNRKKTSQTGLNRFCPKNQTEPKPVGLNRFWFFFLKSGLVTFLKKTEPNKK
jgi:hypothetical protein